MFAEWVRVATIVASLGCGLMAGVFFAFSSFVMPALARLPPPKGMAAMQSINVTAVSPAFGSLFFGSALACVAVLVGALTHWGEERAAYALFGSTAYLAGALLVTALANVPRNDALAAVDPDSPEATTAWASFLRGWIWWNHVRSVASLAAAASLILALL
jgi:uncharacterized membrane protein